MKAEWNHYKISLDFYIINEMLVIIVLKCVTYWDFSNTGGRVYRPGKVIKVSKCIFACSHRPVLCRGRVRT